MLTAPDDALYAPRWRLKFYAAMTVAATVAAALWLTDVVVGEHGKARHGDVLFPICAVIFAYRCWVAERELRVERSEPAEEPIGKPRRLRQRTTRLRRRT